MVVPIQDQPRSQGRPPDEESDRQLVAAFLERKDELAFRALYRRHSAYLYAIACRATAGQGVSPEELLQDTWVRALERLDSFRWQSRFRTWLAGVLFNCRNEALRRSGRGPETSRVAERATSPGDSEQRLDLEHAITLLPDGYRDVVLLHYVYGYPHAEVAEVLDIAVGTSKSQAARGLQRLRVLLGGEEKGGAR